jgi:glycosyltransferase involved in cell wall biosynthesis
MARLLLHYIRGWDMRSANNVDVFVTNSDMVAQRVRKIYRRDSLRVYPPVDLDNFTVQPHKEDFYVTASRLVPYKRVSLIVEAFSRSPRRKLVVIGDGPEYRRISSLAGPNVTLMGYQSFHSLRDHMQRARGFVFAAEEDFGIAPLEAMACGTPVIALRRGGLVETMIPGQTGIFFNEQSPQSLLEALDQFELRMDWDPELIRQGAERFSVARFRQGFAAVVEAEWSRFREERNKDHVEPFTSGLRIAPASIAEPLPPPHPKDQALGR